VPDCCGASRAWRALRDAGSQDGDRKTSSLIMWCCGYWRPADWVQRESLACWREEASGVHRCMQAKKICRGEARAKDLSCACFVHRREQQTNGISQQAGK
jgi:hypothetical protein